MSVEAFGHVWRYGPKSGPSFLVLLAIADVVNDQNGNEFWMSLSNLAKKSRLARSTVTDSVKNLEAGGWLTRLEGGNGKTIRYQFNFVDTEVVWDSRNRTASRTVDNSDRTASRTPPYRQPDTILKRTQRKLNLKIPTYRLENWSNFISIICLKIFPLNRVGQRSLESSETCLLRPLMRF